MFTWVHISPISDTNKLQVFCALMPGHHRLQPHHAVAPQRWRTLKILEDSCQRKRMQLAGPKLRNSILNPGFRDIHFCASEDVFFTVIWGFLPSSRSNFHRTSGGCGVWCSFAGPSGGLRPKDGWGWKMLRLMKVLWSCWGTIFCFGGMPHEYSWDEQIYAYVKARIWLYVCIYIYVY